MASDKTNQPAKQVRWKWAAPVGLVIASVILARSFWPKDDRPYSSYAMDVADGLYRGDPGVVRAYAMDSDLASSGVDEATFRRIVSDFIAMKLASYPRAGKPYTQDFEHRSGGLSVLPVRLPSGGYGRFVVAIANTEEGPKIMLRSMLQAVWALDFQALHNRDRVLQSQSLLDGVERDRATLERLGMTKLAFTDIPNMQTMNWNTLTARLRQGLAQRH